MSSQVFTSNSEAAILARLISAQDGAATPDVAEYLLSFAFQASDIERMNYLAERAQDGVLTREEHDELEGYVHVSNLLAVMQSKARQLLSADAQKQ